MKLAAGIDFGGTSAKIALVDRAGMIRGRTQVVMDPEESFEGILEPVVAALRDLLSRETAPQGLSAIGIGTPGFIDKSDGTLIGGCHNIPSLQRRSVQAFLSSAFGVPAFADNDATCAAAGELAFGAGRSFHSFVLITIGTAIGGGLVLGGQVYRGWRGFAGEIGHLCVNPRGAWCDCGSRGCFEQYASATAIARRYREKRRKQGPDPGQIEAREVVRRAQAGEAAAQDVLEETAEWIAQAFGSLLNVLDLQACLVGGGVSEAGEILLAPVRRRLADHCWSQIGAGVTVLCAELRNDAGVLGAAAQAFGRLPMPAPGTDA